MLLPCRTEFIIYKYILIFKSQQNRLLWFDACLQQQLLIRRLKPSRATVEPAKHGSSTTFEKGPNISRRDEFPASYLI